MTTVAQINEKIFDSISAIIGSTELIAQDQEGYATTESFLTWKIKSWQQLGREGTYNLAGSTDNSEIRTSWKICVNFMAVGKLSGDIALGLANKLNFPTVLDSLDINGLGMMYKNDVKYTPKLLHTGWEPRHLLEVYFGVILTDTDLTGYIESVEVEGTARNESNAIVWHDLQVRDITP